MEKVINVVENFWNAPVTHGTVISAVACVACVIVFVQIVRNFQESKIKNRNEKG